MMTAEKSRRSVLDARKYSSATPIADRLVLARLRASCAFFAAAFALGLAGCTAAIRDPVDHTVLAKCYDGVLLAFCQVRQPPGTTVVSSVGAVPTIGAAGVVAAVAKP